MKKSKQEIIKELEILGDYTTFPLVDLKAIDSLEGLVVIARKINEIIRKVNSSEGEK